MTKARSALVPVFAIATISAAHVVHVNVFLKDMKDFEPMNRAYVAGRVTTVQLAQ